MILTVLGALAVLVAAAVALLEATPAPAGQASAVPVASSTSANYQSVIDRIGRAAVDGFARLFVMPQTGHGLSGTNYNVDGEGRTIPSLPIPNRYDQLGLLFDCSAQRMRGQ
jgi:hypothetical protein